MVRFSDTKDVFTLLHMTYRSKVFVLLQRLLLRFCESTIISKSIRSKPRMLMDMGIDVTIVFFCMVSICFNLIHFEHCIEWSKYKRKHI